MDELKDLWLEDVEWNYNADDPSRRVCIIFLSLSGSQSERKKDDLFLAILLLAWYLVLVARVSKTFQSGKGDTLYLLQDPAHIAQRSFTDSFEEDAPCRGEKRLAIAILAERCSRKNKQKPTDAVLLSCR